MNFHLSQEDLKGCTQEKITFSDVLLVHFSTGTTQVTLCIIRTLIHHSPVLYMHTMYVYFCKGVPTEGRGGGATCVSVCAGTGAWSMSTDPVHVFLPLSL